jgi:hypothetical protein
MRRKFLVTWAALLFSPAMLAQANVVVSENGSDPPPQSKKKDAKDCRSEPTINADGALEFKNCSDTPDRVDRSKFDPSGARGDSPGTASRSAVSVADMDPQTRAKQQQALAAKFDYQAFSFAHAQRTFDFQYRSGRIIFWVVLLIVFAGLAFSGAQFYVGLHHPLESRAKAGNKDSGPDEACVSEFEASLQGIKLKSSVLGLIILAMSMVFFYLYLKYVYPISNISQ